MHHYGFPPYRSSLYQEVVVLSKGSKHLNANVRFSNNHFQTGPKSAWSTRFYSWIRAFLPSNSYLSHKINSTLQRIQDEEKQEIKAAYKELKKMHIIPVTANQPETVTVQHLKSWVKSS